MVLTREYDAKKVGTPNPGFVHTLVKVKMCLVGHVNATRHRAGIQAVVIAIAKDLLDGSKSP